MLGNVTLIPWYVLLIVARRVDLHRRAEERAVPDPHRAHVEHHAIEIEQAYKSSSRLA